MSRHRYIKTALVVFLAACSGGGGEASAPFGIEARTQVQGHAFPLDLPQPTDLQVVRAFPNLSFGAPVRVVAPPDGSDRLCVVDKNGFAHIFPNDESTSSTTIFLDIFSRITRGGEQGFLGLAFHPNYSQNGHIFVSYTQSASGSLWLVVERFTASPPDADQINTTTGLELFRERQIAGNHNGGMVEFGPDNMLYVSLGDGGSQNDPTNAGQDNSRLLGTIVRVDPLGATPYAIPSDNPFVGAGPGVREEIWAYGFRNPWRFSFDRNTGDLWLGDVGQNAREEIDIVTAGGNYGWRLYEGTLNHNSGGVPFATTEAPITEYANPGLGRAVIGGIVYRGNALPSYNGVYVYGDNSSGRIWALVYDGQTVISNDEVANLPQVTSFGEDQQGEMLATSFRNSGSLWKFQETGGNPPPPFPATLSATGLFSDTQNLVAAPGVIEYGVNVPSWSDNALKRRWIALPGIARITFDATGNWVFPVGTVLVKHFELELNPTTTRRLEARVLIRLNRGWEGYVYKWNAGETDADLLAGGDSDTFTVDDPNAPGGQRQQIWTYPSRTDCLSCHTDAAGYVLGVRTRQLNRDFAYPNATDNQLRTWNHIGLFQSGVGPHTSYEAYPDLSDEGRPVAERARAYLDVNCAQCHQPNAPAPGGLDLRFDTALGNMNVVNIPPTQGDLGIPNALRVFPGLKEMSVLWERVRRTDISGMPPIAHNLADPVAEDLLGRWIDQGP